MRKKLFAVLCIIFCCTWAENWFDIASHHLTYFGVERQFRIGPSRPISIFPPVPVYGNQHEFTRYHKNRTFTPCFRLCSDEYAANLGRFVGPLTVDRFDAFPFTEDLFSKRTSWLTSFCEEIGQQSDQCLKGCGLSVPRQYEALPHAFLCTRTEAFGMPCQMELHACADNCLHSLTSNASFLEFNRHKCTSFTCLLNCTATFCEYLVPIVEDYFSFSVERALMYSLNISLKPSFPSEISLLPTECESYLPQSMKARSSNSTLHYGGASLSCSCVLANQQINRDCVSHCFFGEGFKPQYFGVDLNDQLALLLSLLHPTSTTQKPQYHCDMEKCTEQLGRVLFNEQTVLSSLFDVKLVDNGTIYEVSLEPMAQERLGLYVGAPFTVAMFLSYVLSGRDRDTYRCSIFESELQSLQSYRSDIVHDATLSSNQKMRRRLVYKMLQSRLLVSPRLSLSQPVLQFARPQSNYRETRAFELGSLQLAFQVRFEIAGHIFKSTTFSPVLLKRVGKEDQRPLSIRFGFPDPLLLTTVLHSPMEAEVRLKWSCPANWASQPNIYEVVCMLTQPQYHNTYERLECDLEQISDFKSHRECKKLWNEFIRNALTSVTKTVPWHDHYTTIQIRFPEDYHYETLVTYCRLRACNSNGAGDWSPILFGTFSQEPSHAIRIILEYKQENNISWAYSDVYIRQAAPFLAAEELNPTVEHSFQLMPGLRQDQAQYLFPDGLLEAIGAYDWIGDRWFAVVKDQDGSHTMAEVQVNQKINHPRKLFQLAGKAHDIIFYPPTSTLLWTEVSEAVTLKSAQFSEEGTWNVNEMHLNESWQCSSCRALGNLLSPAITLAPGLIKSLNILIHTDQGIWQISMQECKCKRLHLKMHDRFGRIVSMAAFFSEQSRQKYFETAYLYAVSDLGLFYEFEFLYQFPFEDQLDEAIPRKLNNFQIVQPVSHANVHQLEYVPSYASPVSRWRTAVVTRIWVFFQVYPAPVKECMFPNISTVSVIMRSDTTAEVNAVVKWSTLTECHQLSKPKLIYTTKYLLLSANENVSTSTCEAEDCPCYNNPNCRQWRSEPSSNHTSMSTMLFDLYQDREYIIEVDAQPSLGNYKRVWYGDHTPSLTSISSFKSEYTDPNTVTRKILLSVMVPTFTALIVLLILMYYWYRKKWFIYQQIQRIEGGQIEPVKGANDEIVELGIGGFGRVYKATITFPGMYKFLVYWPRRSEKGHRKTVAIKTLREDSNNPERDKASFLEEALLLARQQSAYVVKAVGICLNSRPIQLALEFADGGSLNKYLRKAQTWQHMTAVHLWQIAMDVASGCYYLERKGIIHRDLSAKNCLVQLQINGLLPKIVQLADFGLAKDINNEARAYRTDNFVFPLEFTAPEGFSGTFTSKSDVWSYGVVMWEIFSWCAKPYLGCTIANRDDHHCTFKPLFGGVENIKDFIVHAKQSLNDMETVPCYSNLCQSVRNIMGLCWKFEPKKRPTFSSIIGQLEDNKLGIAGMKLVAPPSAPVAEPQDQPQLPHPGFTVGHYSDSVHLTENSIEMEVLGTNDDET